METNNGKPRPGINFTTDPTDGNIVEGIHLDTFYQYFKDRVDRQGWINLKIVELENPVGKGYTHRFSIVGKPSATHTTTVSIPSVHEGGIVLGPTLGLVGSGRGVSRSNPETIAPLDKLRSMLGEDK